MISALSEFLTVEELATRLKVSRTTVFSWLKNGELRQGVDYFKFGRILRFSWPFSPMAQAQANSEREQTREKKTLKVRRSNKKDGSTPAVNIDY